VNDTVLVRVLDAVGGNDLLVKDPPFGCQGFCV
jgi:hypothetical protein